MSVNRYEWGPYDMVVDPNGRFFHEADHIAEVGKKVAEARREAFAECLANYHRACDEKNVYNDEMFLDWLKARAEGEK